MATKRRKIVKEDLDFGNGTTTIPTDSGGSRAATKIGLDTFLDGSVSVMHVGATGNGTTNDAAAIQAALATGAVSVILPAHTYNLGTTGLTIPSTCRNFWMMPGALLSYTGTGTAVLFDSHTAGEQLEHHRVAVKKTVADWDIATGTGADTTSIGVKILNSISMNVELAEIENFADGYQLLGDAAGCTFNQITLGYLANNKVGVHHKIANAGWTNQNTYYGGQIRIDSPQTTQASGSRYIQLDSGSDNMNLFINTDIENAKAERSLSVAGSENTFISLRYEANQAGAVVISGNYNNLIGAKIDSGVWSSILTDTGYGNLYFSGISGLQMDTSGATGVNFIRVKDGAGNTILNFRGDTRRLIVGNTGVDGKLETVLLTSALTHLDIDVFLRSTASGGFSIGADAGKLRIDSAGTAPYEFRVLNAANVITGWRFAGYVNTGRAQNATGTNAAGANDLTLAGDGNYFQITGGGTINGIAVAGWAGGSEITLYFQQATTVKNNTAASAGFASMRLAGAADFVAALYGQITLIYNAIIGFWVEKCRSVN